MLGFCFRKGIICLCGGGPLSPPSSFFALGGGEKAVFTIILVLLSWLLATVGAAADLPHCGGDWEPNCFSGWPFPHCIWCGFVLVMCDIFLCSLPNVENSNLISVLLPWKPFQCGKRMSFWTRGRRVRRLTVSRAYSDIVLYYQAWSVGGRWLMGTVQYQESLERGRGNMHL